jgi:hypothetical protein
MRRRRARVSEPRSGFAGFRFPPKVIMLAVRWYLRYALSYRDVEELLVERGIDVDHSQIYLHHVSNARPHRTLAQLAPAQAETQPPSLINLADYQVRSRPILDGLTSEYQIAA